MKDIWWDITQIKEGLIKLKNWFKSDPAENKKALAYAGKSLVGVFLY